MVKKGNSKKNILEESFFKKKTVPKETDKKLTYTNTFGQPVSLSQSGRLKQIEQVKLEQKENQINEDEDLDDVVRDQDNMENDEIFEEQLGEQDIEQDEEAEGEGDDIDTEPDDNEEQEFDNKNNEDKIEDYPDYDDEKCIYNLADDRSEDQDQEDLEITFDDDNILIDQNMVPNEERTTKPFLFNYERVRILGDRIKQLVLGAKPLIKNSENLTPDEIANLELSHRIIPLIIERPLPDGRMERWKISEFQYI